jgi:hypothetical protein
MTATYESLMAEAMSLQAEVYRLQGLAAAADVLRDEAARADNVEHFKKLQADYLNTASLYQSLIPSNKEITP